jgi:hypothetical protein
MLLAAFEGEGRRVFRDAAIECLPLVHTKRVPSRRRQNAEHAEMVHRGVAGVVEGMQPVIRKRAALITNACAIRGEPQP